MEVKQEPVDIFIEEYKLENEEYFIQNETVKNEFDSIKREEDDDNIGTELQQTIINTKSETVDDADIKCNLAEINDIKQSRKGRDEIYISRRFAYEAFKFLEDRDEPRKILMTETVDILGNEKDVKNNPQGQPVSTRRPTKRAKVAIDNNASMMSSASNILSEAAKNMDNQPTKPNEIDSFFTYVAAKVDKYVPAVQNSVQHAVFEILMKADTGFYDWAASNPQQFNHWQNPPGVPTNSQQYHLQPLHPIQVPVPILSPSDSLPSTQPSPAASAISEDFSDFV